MQRGESGGKDAAGILHRATVDFVRNQLPYLPEDCTIVAKVFANLTGLAEICERGRVVDSASQVADFTRGFTQGRHLFDFIDVGYGKEKADAKLRGKTRWRLRVGQTTAGLTVDQRTSSCSSVILSVNRFS